MSTLNEISQMVITGQIRTIKAKVQQALDDGIGAQEILDGGLLPGINEIGEKFGLTRERVRQIKEKAIRRLRHSTRSKLLKSYLG
mgnify:CR=1 FL=1